MKLRIKLCLRQYCPRKKLPITGKGVPLQIAQILTIIFNNG
jgi:hypothetical protein